MLIHGHRQPLAPSRVVLLGARGFIAAALRARLAGEVETRALGSVEFDLTKFATSQALAGELRATDAVVMTAALTPDKGRDTATLMRNLQMAETVGAALAAKAVAHFVYLSSDAVYDWSQSLIAEATPPSPTDLYSTMHMARERILAAATTAAKIPYAVLRPCAVYGPGDTHNSYGPNRFARTARQEGRIRLFGAGEEQRDHVFIADVVALIREVLWHRSTGLVNLVSGRSLSFADVAAKIAQLSGLQVTIESGPRSGAVTHRHFDATALRRAFPGHQPTPIDTGLRVLLGAS